MGEQIKIINDGLYTNHFEDKEYTLSLRNILSASYQNMLRPNSSYNHSISLIKFMKEFSNRVRELTIEENSILAEKELSQLELHLITYKNLVELAVHLD